MRMVAVVVEVVPLRKVGLFEEFIAVELAHLLLINALGEGANLVEGRFVDLEVHADLEHLHIIVGELRIMDVADEGIAMAVGLKRLIMLGLGIFVDERGIAVGAF